MNASPRTCVAATVLVRQDQSTFRVQVRTRSGKGWSSEQSGSLASLARARGQISDELLALKSKVKEASVNEADGFIADWHSVRDLSTKIDEISALLTSCLLTPNRPESFFEFLSVLEEQVLAVEARGMVPAIDFICSWDSILPFDLLPVTPRNPPVGMQGPETLASIADRTMGFRTLTRIVVEGCPVAAPTRIEGNPLNVILFQDASLEYSGKELRELVRAGRLRELLRLPVKDQSASSESATEAETKFAEQFVSASVGDASSAAFPHLAHFVGHVKRDAGRLATRMVMTFGAAEDKLSFELDPDMIRVALWNLRRKLYVDNVLDAMRAPYLFFANACGSGEMELDGVGVLPSLFVQEFQSDTFIGPLVDIPDGVAAAFAPYFYRELSTGLEVGQALRNARRTYLFDYRNPLGILYSLFGCAELVVHSTLDLPTAEG